MATPRGDRSPSVKSRWVPRTYWWGFLVGYLTGLTLVVWLSLSGGGLALLREAFWEGGWLAFVFLPLIWGTLIGCAVSCGALFVGAVVRVALVEFDPETERIKEAATQIAARGSAPRASEERIETITAPDQGLELPGGGQQTVSKMTGEPM
jgi:hypothetical protein